MTRARDLAAFVSNADGDIKFDTDTLFIDSSANRVGIGTDTPDGQLHLFTSDASISPDADADDLIIEANGASGITIGSSASSVGSIRFADSGSPRAGMIYYDHVGNAMRFYTNATERMRILSSGAKDFGAHTSGSAGYNIYAGAASASDYAARFDGVGTGASNAVQFVNGYGQVGSITLSGAATAYNTSSDYRLKENISDVTDGITRLKQLKPKRFSWIAEEKNEATLDGFLAHEAQTVVPEAVTGTKDAMTEEVLYVDGDEIPEGKKVGDVKTASTIKPQGIDQSKLVPLLTAALQEAIAKIETLETKVTALEAE